MKVLTVCLGNICRSPMAQGILEAKVEKYHLDWSIDSAGTSGWHDGEHPDQRAIQTCLKNGINIRDQISRKVRPIDFTDFDLILVMDQSNYDNVIKLTSHPKERAKVQLILDYNKNTQGREVPDPYFDNSFDVVYELLDEAIEEVIAAHPKVESVT